MVGHRPARRSRRRSAAATRRAAHDGGEPTFVAIDDMDAEEWTTGAVGRRSAIWRQTDPALARAFCAGGMLHYGWANVSRRIAAALPSRLYARRREAAMVMNRRIAPEQRNSDPTSADAAAFARGIAQRIEVDPAFVAPAYETKRRCSPKKPHCGQRTTADSKLDDPEERAGSRAAFGRD